jgi:hypothetical protein
LDIAELTLVYDKSTRFASRTWRVPMRRVAFICASCAVVLGACSQSGQSKGADTSAVATPPPPPPPAAVALSDFAGKWNLTVMNEAGDTTLMTDVLNATATASGWTVVHPKMKPVAITPSVSGDSLMTDGGPYPSALKKGHTVTTHGVWRLRGGKLVGTTIARYDIKGADSVRTLHAVGTRAP